MKKKLFIYILIATAFVYASCSKNETAPNVAQTAKVSPISPQQLHLRDSIMARFITDSQRNNNALKAGPVVTVTAIKITCNTFRLTVTVNRPFCPKASSQLFAYWTLFDSFGIQNLTPTQGNPCIQGAQVILTRTVTKTDYLYIVLLLMEPNSGSPSGLFISNTIILKPNC